jgi:hypothetical protein
MHANEKFGSRPHITDPGSSPGPNRLMVSALNAGTHLIAEIRRSAGPKTATRALPVICEKLGIPIDLSDSNTLAQGEFDLVPPMPQGERDPPG